MTATASNRQNPDRLANAASGARHLLLSRTNAVLSTLSKKLDGYPFGSLCPFCLDGDGQPVVLISTIAEHTRNLKADPRASLIVTERSDGDVQAGGRVTLVGDFARVDEPGRTAERYYRYFPEARGYHATHDFAFYRMAVRKVRYIGGFGAIHWLEPATLLPANPFTAEQESSMVNHMNEDHVEAMRTYCRNAGMVLADDQSPAMAGVDGDGFDLKVGERVVRFSFEQAVDSPMGVRQALVAMARREP